MKALSIVLAVSLSALSACGLESSPAVDRDSTDYTTGTLRGDVGTLSDINTVGDLTLYSDPEITYYQIDAETAGLAVMSRLSLALPDILTPGLDDIFVNENINGVITPDPAGVSFVACVGSEPGFFDLFDSPASDIHVVVDPDGNVSVDAMLRSGTFVASNFRLQ